jgi:hypothetical protein
MRIEVILAVGFALSLTAGGPAVADGGGGGSDRSNTTTCDKYLKRDRGFESGSLLRRVQCEPDSVRASSHPAPSQRAAPTICRTRGKFSNGSPPWNSILIVGVGAAKAMRSARIATGYGCGKCRKYLIALISFAAHA